MAPSRPPSPAELLRAPCPCKACGSPFQLPPQHPFPPHTPNLAQLLGFRLRLPHWEGSAGTEFSQLGYHLLKIGLNDGWEPLPSSHGSGGTGEEDGVGLGEGSTGPSQCPQPWCDSPALHGPEPLSLMGKKLLCA